MEIILPNSPSLVGLDFFSAFGGRLFLQEWMNYSWSGMHKSQLQELAQKGRFDLPTYSYIREGLHSSRFKATVSFNGEIFESPVFCATLRQAEHVAATVALQSLSEKGCLPDDCGVYKNLLQEMALKGRLPQPVYSVSNSGQLHEPVFTSTVEVAREVFSGAPAKTRKQAEKNAAMVAWSALKQPGSQSSLTSWASDKGGPTDHELTVIEYVQANNNTKELDVQSVSLASTRLGGLSLQEPPASKTSDKRTDKDLEQIMMATVRASRHVTLNNIIINHLLHSFLQVQRSEFFPVKRLQYWPGMPMLYHLATWHGWQWK